MATEYESNPKDEKILWSSISRNGTILAEAGGDPFNGAVSETAQTILAKKNTPGWEFCTLKNGDGWFGKPKEPNQNRAPKLKGIKFHVYEHAAGGSWDSSDVLNSASGDNDNNNQIVWVFAAVYNPELPSWGNSKFMVEDVKSFLEKIIGLTEMPRSCDPIWKTGGTLACQATFAPILLQRMQEVTYLGTMARLQDRVDGAKELMQSNITAILDREEQLRDLENRSSKLEEAASVFKKSTKGVRRRMMMQNAKYGVLLGSAVTVGVAVVIVPPLVAIL